MAKIQFHVHTREQMFIVSGRTKLVELLGQLTNRKGQLVIAARNMPNINIPMSVATHLSKEVLEGRSAIVAYLGESFEVSTPLDVYSVFRATRTERLYMDDGIVKSSATTPATVFRDTAE